MLILKHLEFRDGFVYIGDSQVCFRPFCMYLVLFNHILNKYSKEKIKKIFRNASIEDCNIWFKKIKAENFDRLDCKIISKFLEYINLLGFGDIKLRYIFKKKILFSQINSFASKKFRKIYQDKSNILVEEILVAYLENFLKLYFDRYVKVNIFENKGEISYEADILEEEFSFKNKFKYQKKIESRTISNVLKHLIYKKLIYKNKGIIRMNSIYMINVPYLFYFKLIEQIYDDNFEIFFKNMGIANGKSQYSWFKPTKDYNYKEWILKTNELFEISGFGKFIYHSEGDYLIYANNFQYFYDFFDEKIVNSLKNRVTFETKSFYDHSINNLTRENIENDKITFENTNEKVILNNEQKKIYDKCNIDIILDKF